MPVNSLEIRPTVTPPLESTAERDQARLDSIKEIAARTTGETSPTPINTDSKIVIEVSDQPQTPQTSSTNLPVSESFFSRLGHTLERLGNLRRTFFLKRFGTTRSKEGLDAALERAVDKAEQQGQTVNSVQT